MQRAYGINGLHHHEDNNNYVKIHSLIHIFASCEIKNKNKCVTYLTKPQPFFLLHRIYK